MKEVPCQKKIAEYGQNFPEKVVKKLGAAGNLYSRERPLHGLCSCQPTIELAVDKMKNIVCKL